MWAKVHRHGRKPHISCNTFGTEISWKSVSLSVRPAVSKKWDWFHNRGANCCRIVRTGKKIDLTSRKSCPFHTEKWFIHKILECFLWRIQKYGRDRRMTKDRMKGRASFCSHQREELCFCTQLNSTVLSQESDLTVSYLTAIKTKLILFRENWEIKIFFNCHSSVCELEAETADLLILTWLLEMLLLACKMPTQKQWETEHQHALCCQDLPDIDSNFVLLGIVL